MKNGKIAVVLVLLGCIGSSFANSNVVQKLEKTYITKLDLGKLQLSIFLPKRIKSSMKDDNPKQANLLEISTEAQFFNNLIQLSLHLYFNGELKSEKLQHQWCEYLVNKTRESLRVVNGELLGKKYGLKYSGLSGYFYDTDSNYASSSEFKSLSMEMDKITKIGAHIYHKNGDYHCNGMLLSTEIQSIGGNIR